MGNPAPSRGRPRSHDLTAGKRVGDPIRRRLTLSITWLATRGRLAEHRHANRVRGADVWYRPTCHYAYHPCDDAVLSLHELNGKNGELQTRKRLMVDEIVKGVDELGVLLMGNTEGVYWYGSRLSIDQTRELVPYNNATSLQVTVGVLSGMIWALENLHQGIVEPEQMDFARALEIAGPYLGDIVGVWGTWSPLDNREHLFTMG